MRFEKEVLTSCGWRWSKLTGRAELPACSTESLLDEMWCAVVLALASPDQLRFWLCVLADLQAWLLEVVFPSHMKTHRHGGDLTLLLASLLTMQGLLQLSAHRSAPWAVRICHLASGPLRRLFFHLPSDPEAVAQAVAFLRHCVETAGVDDEACVYTLFNQGRWYVGKAVLARSHGKLGVVSRIMEHLTSVLRTRSAAARTTRAILLRQRPASEICFLILKRGPHTWIRACEAVAIRCLRPLANQGQCLPMRRKKCHRSRKRPPPRFRRRKEVSFWESPVCLQRQCKIVQQKLSRPFGNLAPSWTVQTFSAAYRSKQKEQYAKWGLQGPISIYATRQGGLLALWACSKHAHLDLRLLLKGRGPARAILRLAHLISLVHGYVRQSNGFRHVDRLLARYHLPSRRHRWFPCLTPEERQQVRHAVTVAARACAALHGQFLYHWIMARVHFTTRAVPRLSDRRNAVQCSKLIRVSDVWEQGFFEWEHWRRGAEVKKLPGNWAVPDQKAIWAKSPVVHELRAWHVDNHFPRQIGRASLRAWSSVHRSANDYATAKESAYVEVLTSKGSDVLLQDDKDKKSTWTMPFARFATTLLCLVLLDTQWDATAISVEQLSTLVYGVSLFAIPAALRRGPLPKTSFAPYMYPFVKAKCFAASGGHTCQKIGHSCLRKVVSFVHVPWRRAWRLGGRAVQILISSTGPGFSVWKLKQVVPIFRQKFGMLRWGPDPQECICCNGPKWYTTLLVADAAQMYEQVDSRLVLDAFDAKAALLLQLQEKDTITVRRQFPVRGWPGGSIHTRSRNFIVFSVAQLRRMLQASCMLRFASIGNLVVKARGLVIGGLVSMISAVCLLSFEEEQFLQGGWTRVWQVPPQWEIHELFFGLRYVDDLLLVSGSLCHQCLRTGLCSMFSVHFDINPEEAEQTWTDLVFSVDPMTRGVSWTAKNPNRLWVQGKGDKKKERYVPFLGRLQCPFGMLRCLLLGRLARLRELELPAESQLVLLFEEIQELILEGYPISILRAVIHSLPLHTCRLLSLRRAIRVLDNKRRVRRQTNA